MRGSGAIFARMPFRWLGVRGVLVELGHHRQVFHAAYPTHWPWWRLASFWGVRMSIHPPSKAWRLWIYTRWWNFFVGVYFDRRAIDWKPQ